MVSVSRKLRDILPNLQWTRKDLTAMKNTEYSLFKASRHPEVIADLRRETHSVGPVHVHWVLSDLCNHGCLWCTYRTPGYTSSQRFFEVTEKRAGTLIRDKEHPERNYNPKRWIPTERALDLIGEMSEVGVRAVQLTGGGEPTTHPDFNLICQAIRKHNIEYAIVSNGALIKPRNLIDDFVMASWVRISVDAGTPRTYATTRNVPEHAFHTAWAGIRDLVERRNKLGVKNVIGVAFTVTPQNWQEVHEATAMARSVGADNIRISAMFSNEGAEAIRPFYEGARREVAMARELATPTFQVFDRFGDRLGDLEQQNPDYEKCWYQHFTTYIGADQNVYRCCVYAYNDRGLLGSIATQSLHDLWFAPTRQHDMLAFDARKCQRCMFNGTNRYMDYVISRDDPPHASFV